MFENFLLYEQKLCHKASEAWEHVVKKVCNGSYTFRNKDLTL